MLFNGLIKYYRFSFIFKIGTYCAILLFVACEDAAENTVDSGANGITEELENTLNDNLNDDNGDINEYFYNLSSDQINAKYYRYDHNAMENPQFYFDQASDTLNFSTFPCY